MGRFLFNIHYMNNYKKSMLPPKTNLFNRDGIITNKFRKWIIGYISCDFSCLIVTIIDNWDSKDSHNIVRIGDSSKISWSFHTSGLSSNESIVKALKKTVFWDMFWFIEKRGGHLEMIIPDNMIREISNKL